MLNRARVLLKVDTSEHATDALALLAAREIAWMLETSSTTVGRERERFCRQGIDVALERSMPDWVYERSFDGRAVAVEEARLIALTGSEPRVQGALEYAAVGGGGCGIGRRRVGLPRDALQDAQKTSSVPT